jgi:hypothetical protein
VWVGVTSYSPAFSTKQLCHATDGKIVTLSSRRVVFPLMALIEINLINAGAPALTPRDSCRRRTYARLHLLRQSPSC